MSMVCTASPPSAQLKRALVQAADRLAQAKVHRPCWTAEQLLSHQLEVDPITLHLDPPVLTDLQRIQFLKCTAARASGVPLQYLLGKTDFYGRTFHVGPGVFIPRPETEVLIEAALKTFTVHPESFDPPSVRPELVEGHGRLAQDRRASKDTLFLDVGTGCGTIAVTLALERPEWKLFACDLSVSALRFARRNANLLKASVQFFQGDLSCAVRVGAFDGMVANLPYLNPAQSDAWPAELAWEPQLALDGGQGGAAAIRRLLGNSHALLKPGGVLLLEIGEGHAELLQQTAAQLRFTLEPVIRDLAGLERVAVLRRVR